MGYTYTSCQHGMDGALAYLECKGAGALQLRDGGRRGGTVQVVKVKVKELNGLYKRDQPFRKQAAQLPLLTCMVAACDLRTERGLCDALLVLLGFGARFRPRYVAHLRLRCFQFTMRWPEAGPSGGGRSSGRRGWRRRAAAAGGNDRQHLRPKASRAAGAGRRTGEFRGGDPLGPLRILLVLALLIIWNVWGGGDVWQSLRQRRLQVDAERFGTPYLLPEFRSVKPNRSCACEPRPCGRGPVTGSVRLGLPLWDWGTRYRSPKRLASTSRRPWRSDCQKSLPLHTFHFVSSASTQKVAQRPQGTTSVNLTGTTAGCRCSVHFGSYMFTVLHPRRRQVSAPPPRRPPLPPPPPLTPLQATPLWPGSTTGGGATHPGRILAPVEQDEKGVTRPASVRALHAVHHADDEEEQGRLLPVRLIALVQVVQPLGTDSPAP
eukprot:SM000153S01597  [mRNA]  locus=s153:112858:114159:+ [translate_table: standard]